MNISIVLPFLCFLRCNFWGLTVVRSALNVLISITYYFFFKNLAISSTSSGCHASEFKTPLCTDVDYNYYVKNGYYIDKYDFNSAAAIISKQLKNDAAYIMFSSKSELDKAVNDLCKSEKISQITGNSAGVTYYCNEDFYTLTFILKW